MSKEITVILARASWCGHCQNFEPIYNMAKKDNSNQNLMNKYKIEFKDYDMANDDVKTNFVLSHHDAMELVEGYPTVLLHINDKEKRTNKYYTIAHTIANEQIKDDTAQIKDASKRFINNISNLIKSIDSDGKVLYTQAQSGGAIKNHQTSLQEEIYRKKYLKYKYKYLKFK